MKMFQLLSFRRTHQSIVCGRLAENSMTFLQFSILSIAFV